MLAAGQVLIDDVGFGPASLQPGNLLRYADQSVEETAAGWTASVNCSIARSSAQDMEGWYSVAITSTAAGDVQVRSVATPAVTAGAEYFGYAYTRTPIALSVAVELWWYDAGATLLSTTSATTVTAVTTWQRIGVSGRAPAGATTVRLVIRPTATTSAQVVYADQMTIRVAPSNTGNLLSYAAENMETGSTEWVAAGNCTITRSGAQTNQGMWSLQVTATAAGQARVEAVTLAPVTEGLYYSARQYHYGTTAHQVWTDIDWYAADGTTYLGRAWPDQDPAAALSVWSPNTIGRLAPAGAAFARVVSLPQASAPGQVVFLDVVTLMQTDPPYILTPQQSTASVTLQLNNLAFPGTVTLSRVHPDGSRQPVRAVGGDAVALVTTGTIMIFEDYEAPLGVPIHYEYTSGSVSTGTYDVVVPPPDDPAMLWLKDPGQPARNVCVLARSTSAWSRKIDRGVYPVRGARMPVVVSDTRQSREGSVQVYTRDPDEEAALDWLLDTGSVLLLQGLNLGSVYVSVGDSDDAPVDEDGSDVWRVWTLPIIEVARPLGGMAGTAGRTWQDVFDDYDTWQEVFDAYETWLGVLTGVEGT